MSISNVWDEETIRHLRDLWAQGFSTAEIGRRLSVSKNAIVGKAHRLDLDARPSPIKRDGYTPPMRRAAPTGRTSLPPLPSTLPELFQTVAVVPAPKIHGGQKHTSEADEARIRQLAANGLNHNEIARKTGFSRDVIRRVRGRMRRPAYVPQSEGNRPQAEQADQARMMLMAAAGVRQETISRQTGFARDIVQTIIAPFVAPANVVQFQERRVTRPCAFPIGDPGTRGFRFCDDTSEPGKPYCDLHCGICFVKTRDREEVA